MQIYVDSFALYAQEMHTCYSVWVVIHFLHWLTTSKSKAIQQSTFRVQTPISRISILEPLIFCSHQCTSVECVKCEWPTWQCDCEPRIQRGRWRLLPLCWWPYHRSSPSNGTLHIGFLRPYQPALRSLSYCMVIHSLHPACTCMANLFAVHVQVDKCWICPQNPTGIQ